jgi:hypothetical protein
MKVSKPSCPRSFIPHPNSSPYSVKNSEKVDPHIILFILSFFKVVISYGSYTLLFSIPIPGSNESAEKPSPN